MKFRKQTQQQQEVKRGSLNMGIARAHEVASQLVGMQLAASNLIAITVSASSIVAGTITYAVLNQPGAWPFWLAAGVIGALLALLIEGMTLGALIRIRLATKQIHLIVAKLEAERDDAARLTGGKHKGQYGWWTFGKRKRYATRTYRKSRRYSIPLAFVGATASATAGGLFYHQILGSLGTIQSIGVSALFALIVTGTFVSSELFRDVQEEAVRESFKGGSLSEEALREETYRQTNQAVAAEVSTYLASQDAKDAIKKAAGQLLSDVLAELRKKSAERVGHTTVTETATGQAVSGQAVPLLPEKSGQAAMTTGHYEAASKPANQTRPDGQTVIPANQSATVQTGQAVTGHMTNPAIGQSSQTATNPANPFMTEQATLKAAIGQPKPATPERPDGHYEAATNPANQMRPDGQAAMTTGQEQAANPLTGHMSINAASGQAAMSNRPAAKRPPDTEPMNVINMAVRRPTSTGQLPPASGLEQEPDTESLTAKLTAYRLEHPTATQADIARALGTSERTLRRKLAAERSSQTNESVS